MNIKRGGTQIKVVSIKTERLFEKYHNAPRFSELCRQCSGFGKTWACPPYDFTTEDIFRSKTDIYIAGLKINTADIDCATSSQKELNKFSKAILDKERLWLDARLLELEGENNGSFALFAGSCANCPAPKCTRTEGMPCVQPQKMRHSLESLGFDVNAIARDELGIPLLWGVDGKLPEYFTLVTALVCEGESDIAESSFA